MNRRGFIGAGACLLAAPIGSARAAAKLDLRTFERGRILKAARAYLKEQPITVTASSSPRSAGGKHDFFSEADYWWPDPANPNGPYIQRDGQTNPENFDDHRKAMRRLSVQMPALAAAWVVTKEKRYADHAAKHLRAWFVDAETLMNPSLLYSQAIRNKVTGRSIGVIDTIHLVEVARAASVLGETGGISAEDLAAVKKWFGQYLTWLTTHEYGTTERDAKNNHGTCWVLQAAEFARLVGNQAVTADCKDRYKKILLPGQFAPDGSFPQELRRTKPYGYSLFNIDIFAGVCQILSTPEDNLWTLELPDGRGMPKAMAYIHPFIADKKKWPLKPDVMYWKEWPIRHPCLLFGGLALKRDEYITLWKKLDGDPKVDEVIRNFPIRQPVLWV
jgi:hypothetical protein